MEDTNSEFMRSIKLITDKKANFQCSIHNQAVINICISSSKESELLEPLCQKCLNQKNQDEHIELSGYPLDFCNEIKQDYQRIQKLKEEDQKLLIETQNYRFQEFYQESIEAIQMLQKSIQIFKQQLEISLSSFKENYLENKVNQRNFIDDNVKKICEAENLDQFQKALSGFKRIQKSPLQLFPFNISSIQEIENEKITIFSQQLSFEKEVNDIWLNVEGIQKSLVEIQFPKEIAAYQQKQVKFDTKQSQLILQERNFCGYQNIVGLQILSHELCAGFGFQKPSWYLFIAKIDQKQESIFQVEAGSQCISFLRCIKKVSCEEIICGIQKKVLKIDFKAQKLVKEFDSGDQNMITGIEMGNDGEIFIAKNGSFKILCFETQGINNQFNFKYSLEGHTNMIRQIQIIYGLLFSCSNDCTLRVWDVQTKSNLILVQNEFSIYDFGYSEYNQKLFICGSSNFIYQISITSRELIHDKHQKFPEIAGEITGSIYGIIMEISKDGLFVGSSNQGLVYFDIQKKTIVPFENTYKGLGFCNSISLTKENNNSVLLFLDDSQQRINLMVNIENYQFLIAFYRFGNDFDLHSQSKYLFMKNRITYIKCFPKFTIFSVLYLIILYFYSKLTFQCSLGQDYISDRLAVRIFIYNLNGSFKLLVLKDKNLSKQSQWLSLFQRGLKI